MRDALADFSSPSPGLPEEGAHASPKLSRTRAGWMLLCHTLLIAPPFRLGLPDLLILVTSRIPFVSGLDHRRAFDLIKFVTKLGGPLEFQIPRGLQHLFLEQADQLRLIELAFVG